MFEYYENIHVYSSEAGSDYPPGSIFFCININILSICSFPASFAAFNYILTIFPIQMHWRPKLTMTLPWEVNFAILRQNLSFTNYKFVSRSTFYADKIQLKHSKLRYNVHSGSPFR